MIANDELTVGALSFGTYILPLGGSRHELKGSGVCHENFLHAKCSHTKRDLGFFIRLGVYVGILTCGLILGATDFKFRYEQQHAFLRTRVFGRLD